MRERLYFTKKGNNKNKTFNSYFYYKLICCIDIIEVKQEPFDIRSGIDFSMEKFGDDIDREELFCMNAVSNKYNPGGPSCTYKGVKFPYFVKFSDNGRIAGHIIVDVLKNLNALKLYDNDRENSILSALLVGGHYSYFYL